jgi:hypothetical protein
METLEANGVLHQRIRLPNVRHEGKDMPERPFVTKDVSDVILDLRRSIRIGTDGDGSISDILDQHLLVAQPSTEAASAAAKALIALGEQRISSKANG